MKRRPKKQHRAISFRIAEVFPSSDPAAVDLLRLMSGNNDLVFLDEWIAAHLKAPRHANSRAFAAGRRSTQARLLAAFLYEILNALDDIKGKPYFRELQRLFDKDGLIALTRLKAILRAKSKPPYSLLYQIRNKATFHYDRGETRTSLTSLLGRYPQSTSTILLLRRRAGEKTPSYYVLADEVRTEISFGLSPQNFQTQFDSLRKIARDFTVVLECALLAYISSRKLDRYFSNSTQV